MRGGIIGGWKERRKERLQELFFDCELMRSTRGGKEGRGKRTLGTLPSKLGKIISYDGHMQHTSHGRLTCV
jgi:hypothetical protein